MNLKDEAARRRAGLERLHALFAFLERVEPALTSKAQALIAEEMAANMPRVRAYAIETREHRISMSFTLTFDFNERQPGVELATQIVPPAYSNVRTAAL